MHSVGEYSDALYDLLKKFIIWHFKIKKSDYLCLLVAVIRTLVL